MTPFITWLFKRKTKNAKEWIDSLKQILSMKNELKFLNEELDKSQLNILKDQSDDVYISLSNLVKYISDNTSNTINITDLMKECKHISELNNQAFSVIEVYPIIENEHVVLCPDKDACEVHKNYQSEKIKISMVR